MKKLLESQVPYIYQKDAIPRYNSFLSAVYLYSIKYTFNIYQTNEHIYVSFTW